MLQECFRKERQPRCSRVCFQLLQNTVCPAPLRTSRARHPWPCSTGCTVRVRSCTGSFRNFCERVFSLQFAQEHSLSLAYDKENTVYNNIHSARTLTARGRTAPGPLWATESHVLGGVGSCRGTFRGGAFRAPSQVSRLRQPRSLSGRASLVPARVVKTPVTGEGPIGARPSAGSFRG